MYTYIYNNNEYVHNYFINILVTYTYLFTLLIVIVKHYN